MARKKKEEKEIEWSEYQKNIFDFVEHGQGNAVVEACAGAGKTATLIQCVKLIPDDKRILLAAFNKDIVKVLAKKSKGMDNVEALTMHSLGLNILKRNFPKKKCILEPLKYKSFISTNIKTLSSISTYKLSKKNYHRYMNNINSYVEFGRCYMAQTVKDLDFIEERYGIDTIADEKEVAIKAMEFGKNHLEEIDYTDMIWLPIVLSCKPIGTLYDWIFVDEAQDLSVCQREIILKCRKINTRLIMVGDKNQCLYAFSSADPDSFKRLKELPNTISLPLSVSYRCADSIINYAKELVPTIEKNNDNRKGEILENVSLEEIRDGDMVLCRNNAPLMQIYVELIKQGKKTFIRGKDIGSNLINIINYTGQDELNANLEGDGIFVRLYDQMFDIINEMIGKYNITYSDAIESPIVSNKLDIIYALKILSDGLKTKDELIERIKNIFSDRKSGGIALSTIHKAKGLEADNVYIACRSLMPSKNAKHDWEIRQEYNIMYVAYTRAKNRLGFLDETEFNNFINTGVETVKHLKAIEEHVNFILQKEAKKIDPTNKYIADDIIRHATNIERPKEEFKVISFEENNNSNNSLTSLFANRRKSKRKIWS